MKYKLVGKLPGVKIGAEFEYVSEDMCNFNNKLLTRDDSSYLRQLFLSYRNNPDWFELIDDTPKRWRAKLNRDFWFVRADCTVTETYDRYELGFGGQYHVSGNYFRTREQAQAAADAIKAVLQFIQYIPSKEYPIDSVEEKLWNICKDQIELAATAVQNGQAE